MAFVRQQSKLESVLSLVLMWVWCTQIQLESRLSAIATRTWTSSASKERNSHSVPFDGKAVLAVVEQRHAVAVLGQVNVLVPAHFELRGVPSRIPVSWSRQITELRLVESLARKDLDWNLPLEEAVLFVPVDLAIEAQQTKSVFRCCNCI